ncbi:MAG: hypothetical protein K6A15_04600 [Treponema sp.]|nr:hypothetical protein [Treponema sp.]
MEPSQAIEKMLPAFEQYYTVKKESLSPFCAEAEFRSHNEQYFLVRSAHIADIDSNEFVYFASPDQLDTEKLSELVNTAWAAGLEKVHPYNGHRNSDVSLLIFTKSVSEETIQSIKKTKFYKSYKFSLHGWSHFKLAVCNVSDLSIYSNRQGRDFTRLIKRNLKIY